MNSHSNGWMDRVTMSRLSWRSLRSSACAIARVPLAMRSSGPAARAPARWPSAETAGDAALGADIGQPPSMLVVDPVAGHRREDLLQGLGPVARAQLRGLALLDQPAQVHDRQTLAVALG